MPFEFSYTLVIVFAGAGLLGVIGGVIGCFALLRRQSLLGDALAHAALPGVCIAFLLTGSKTPVPLLLGALVAGVLGSLFILAVVRYSRVKEDSAMGIVLSTFFGVGIILLTVIQRSPAGNQSGLDHFLFGQAAALSRADVIRMAVLGLGVLAVVVLFFKEFKIATFDPDFAASIGRPVRLIEVLLTAILVVVVVIGLQTVGVILVIATLVAPAVAARQWTNRLGVMLVIAGAVGGASAGAGAIYSAVESLPTGPTIVVVSSTALVVSLLFAPGRGLLWGVLQNATLRRRIRRENLLKDIYGLGERAGDVCTAAPWTVLMGLRGQGRTELARHARPLVRRGLLDVGIAGVRLTAGGVDAAARVVRKHRLWELYLTRRVEVASDHVHRDADAMEHFLSEDAVRNIDRLLGFPAADPHGRPIPRFKGASE